MWTFFLTAAFGAPGVPSWNVTADQEFGWEMQSKVTTSALQYTRGQNNIDVRIQGFQTRLKVRCKAEHVKKKTVELNCSFDDVWLGAASPNPEDKVMALLDEWDQVLLSAQARVIMGLDGVVRSFDLEGLPQGNERIRESGLQLRENLKRVFSLLDHKTPSKDDEKQWIGRTPLVAGIPEILGNTGKVPMQYTLDSASRGRSVVLGSGKGVISSNITLATNNSERPANSWEMNIMSKATFDDRGFLAARQLLATGQLTPSSQLLDGTAGTPYVQELRLKYRKLGIDEPAYPANEVVGL